MNALERADTSSESSSELVALRRMPAHASSTLSSAARLAVPDFVAGSVAVSASSDERAAAWRRHSSVCSACSRVWGAVQLSTARWTAPTSLLCGVVRLCVGCAVQRSGRGNKANGSSSLMGRVVQVHSTRHMHASSAAHSKAQM